MASMTSTPYVSRRTGSTQWLMQRVSAFLLVGLAFLHFGIQHFTSDAVSTGLTVAARLNNVWWQAYYAIFISLALYHGINGLTGIIRDYNPRPNLRLPVELLIWTAAAFFGGRAIINIANPVPIADVKANYAARGFPAGISTGNPPATEKFYDFRSELRELLLLQYYLEKHTHGEVKLSDVFGAGDKAVDVASVTAAGDAFDRWLSLQLSTMPPAQDVRDRHWVFSSTYEFALWAKDVRRANATARESTDTTAHQRSEVILGRLHQMPAYSPVFSH